MVTQKLAKRKEELRVQLLGVSLLSVSIAKPFLMIIEIAAAVYTLG
jgi:hypothetical protein